MHFLCADIRHPLIRVGKKWVTQTAPPRVFTYLKKEPAALNYWSRSAALSASSRSSLGFSPSFSVTNILIRDKWDVPTLIPTHEFQGKRNEIRFEQSRLGWGSIYVCWCAIVSLGSRMRQTNGQNQLGINLSWGGKLNELKLLNLINAIRCLLAFFLMIPNFSQCCFFKETLLNNASAPALKFSLIPLASLKKSEF